jgi:hypothetical protein
VCGSAAVCGSATIMCGSVRKCQRQCAVVRVVVRTARSARGSVRQCAAVVIIVVILQPPCFATNCCYNNTAAPVLRNNYYYYNTWSSTDLRGFYGRVIHGSAGGLRTGHLRTAGGLRIYGWVRIGWSTGYPCRGHGVPIGLIYV